MAETEEKKVDVRANEIRTVDPKDIYIQEGFNIRDFDRPEMVQRVKDLAEDIATNGQREAIKVRRGTDGKLNIVSGETRYRAIKFAIKRVFRGRVDRCSIPG
jgi:ParB-like chromosome segregation protein Spo0J